MKQFLRYQISGMVFIGWVIIFYAVNYDSFLEGLRSIVLQDNSLALGGFVSALPIGVLIHQFSVLIKNCILANDCKFFSDHPSLFNLQALDGKNSEQAKYILERISNLNSFYYVRFDNGLLAPFFSIIFFLSFDAVDLNLLNISYAFTIAFFIACITVFYIYKIREELEYYFNLLDSLEISSNGDIPLVVNSCQCPFPKIIKIKINFK